MTLFFTLPSPSRKLQPYHRPRTGVNHYSQWRSTFPKSLSGFIGAELLTPCRTVVLLPMHLSTHSSPTFARAPLYVESIYHLWDIADVASQLLDDCLHPSLDLHRPSSLSHYLPHLLLSPFPGISLFLTRELTHYHWLSPSIRMTSVWCTSSPVSSRAADWTFHIFTSAAHHMNALLLMHSTMLGLQKDLHVCLAVHHTASLLDNHLFHAICRFMTTTITVNTQLFDALMFQVSPGERAFMLAYHWLVYDGAAFLAASS